MGGGDEPRVSEPRGDRTRTLCRPMSTSGPEDAVDTQYLPQFATVQDAEISSADWFVEPAWKGERLMARLDGGQIELTNEFGDLLEGREAEEAARVIAEAIDADQALIDGSWTAMPFVGEGSPARQWAKTVAEQGSGEAPDPVSLERRRAFVAWDLVELDGQSLRDIPFQERRRLLESVIIENIRVRVSPTVRMPIRGWLTAWKSDGFTHFVAKRANSRYRQGETTPDWLQVPLDPEKPPSFVGRILGQRPRRVRRIADG